MDHDLLIAASIKQNWGAARIAGLYLLIGCLWILFSDQLAALIAPDQAMLARLSMFKGWGYVFVTALLFYWLIRRHTTTLAASQAQPGLVMDAIPALIAYVDTNKRYRFNNHAYDVWFGHPPSQIQGQRLDEFLGTAAYAAIATYVEKALTGQRTTFESWVPFKDGRERFIQATYIPDIGPDGRVKGFFALVNDLTKHKQTEEQLRQSEAALKQAQRVAHVGSWKWHIQSNRLEWSDEMYHIFGIKKETFSGELSEVIGRAIHPDDRAAVEQSNLAVIKDKKSVPLEYRVIWPDGTVRVVWAEAGELILDDAGSPAILTGIVQDITERKQAEEAQQQSELLFRTLFELSPDAVVLLDPHDPNVSSRIVDCNAAACLMNGYERDELIGQSIEIVNANPYTQAGRIAYLKKLREGGNLKLEVLHRHKSGAVFPVEVSTTIIKVGERELVIGIDRDVTERKQAEETLAAERALLRAIIDILPALVYAKDTACRKILANRVDLEYMGVPTEAEALGKTDLDFYPRDMAARFYARDQAIIQTGQPLIDYEHSIVKADGQQRWLLTSKVPLRDSAGQVIGLVGVGLDITERKRAEEEIRASEERYRGLFEHMVEGYAYCQMIFEDGEAQDWIYLAVNDAFETLTGLKDVAGKRVTEAIPGIREADPGLFDIYARVSLLGQPEKFEIFVQALKMWFSVSVYSPEKGYFVAVFDVITERKRAEEEIRATLEEKEVLLREVHHRVKNNLQAIIALAEMRLEQAVGAPTHLLLKEFQEQARTMSLVYEQLYQSDNLAQVNMRLYLENLATNVWAAFGEDRDIDLCLEIAPVTLDVNAAMPCGLIVNELFTNALKYAFPPPFSEPKRITIGLKAEADRRILWVSDNGIGLPPGLDWRQAQSLGWRLVKLWATHQLGGSLEVDTRAGTMVTVTLDRPG
jgi:PAS domain S-box-containing protein